MNTIKRLPGMLARASAYVLATFAVVIIGAVLVLAALLRLLF